MGRDPTAGELYAAHFLGPQGSAKLIEAVRDTPGAPAAALFPDAAASNPTIFYHGGRQATVGELYANLTRAQSAAPVHAQPSAVAPSADGFLQYASARRLDRMQQEEAMVEMVLRGPQEPDSEGGLGGSGSGNGGVTGVAGAMFSADMLRVLSDARHGKGRSG
jgi:hypothetical protein